MTDIEPTAFDILDEMTDQEAGVLIRALKTAWTFNNPLMNPIFLRNALRNYLYLIRDPKDSDPAPDVINAEKLLQRLMKIH